ncbi:MAG: sulfotransferase family protein [Candidatus Hydrogenedentota bacterium]
MATPIFVMGKHRSGTKWLSNILSNHPDVASVQRDGADGILEADVLLTYPQIFGDLGQDENYCAMAAAFSRSNFFVCTGLDEAVLFSAKIEGYCAFFRHVMDAFAAKENKQYWLQKSNSVVFPMLHAAFPDAKFIVIERDMVDNIRSSIGLARMHGQREASLAKEVGLYQLSRRTMQRYLNKSNVLHVTYEDLRADREQLTRRICGFLGLPFAEVLLTDRYAKNTSFRDSTKRDEALSAFDIARIRAFGLLFRALPFPVLRALRARFGRAKDDRRSRFISKSYLILRKQYGWGEEE